MQAARVDTARNSTRGCTFFHSKSSTGATPLTLISIMATALKMNCAVETRPGSGSAFKQSLLMSSIEAEDIEYMIIAETDALVSLVSSGIVLSPTHTRRGVLLATRLATVLQLTRNVTHRVNVK